MISVEKLPQNKEFSMHPSDGLGCDYGNNWNSIHYGKKRVTDIRIQVYIKYIRNNIIVTFFKRFLYCCFCLYS